MSRTHCEHCKALVTPGASFCLACFIPFEDEAPADRPAAPFENAAPYGVPVEAPVPAAVGAPGGGDFFAAPPPTGFTHHPGEHVDWRVNAPTAAMLTPGARQPKSKLPVVVVSVVGVLLLVGTVFGAKALFSSPSEQEEFAIAFREARPPDFLPTLPDFGSFSGLGGADAEGPGDAKAYVQSIEPQVKAGTDGLLAMQRTLESWADGKVSDDTLRTEIAALRKTLDAAVDLDMVMEAPASTRRGLEKLNESVIEYRMALGSLLDWLDSRNGGARMTYRLSVGSANLHWDEGLINLYRAAGLPTPALPHPPPKKK